MTIDAVSVVLMTVSAIAAGTIVKLWFSGSGGHKLDTCMELQTQTINLLAKKADDIDDNTKGTYSVVKSTHERVGRMESIQACHGQEHDSHSTSLDNLQRTCQELPLNIKTMLGT